MEDKAGTHDDRFQPPPHAPPSYEQAQQPQTSGYPHQQQSSYPHPQPSGYPHPQQSGYSQPQPVFVQPTPTVVAGSGVTVVQPTTSTTVYVANHANSLMFVTPLLGHDPAMITCRSCNQQVVTRVDYQPSARTHLTALFCCLIGFWPCIFIPYCTNTCMSAQHYCPNCNAFLGACN